MITHAGEQRVGSRAAGPEHQGPDGGIGRAPRLHHPGAGGGPAQARRGAGGSSGGAAELDGACGPCGVHSGVAEGDRPAVFRAGCSPDA